MSPPSLAVAVDKQRRKLAKTPLCVIYFEGILIAN